MKRLLMAAMAIWGLGAAPSWLNAQTCCYAPPCVTYQPCVVTCYRPDWREEKVPVQVDNWTSREVVQKVKVQVMVPHWTDESKVVVSCRYEPKIVQSDIVRCCYVPMCTIDPCTCCPTTCWVPQTYVQRVACTVYEAKQFQTVVPVKVCRMVAEERVVETRHCVWENNPVQVMAVRRYCVMVPQPTTVMVPVYTPCCTMPCVSCYMACCPW